ncbi:MAG: response regulator transcription factor [Candidatus Omnitrophota bacterium]
MKNSLIAIVDDEQGIIKTISEYLGNKGLTVMGFSDAEALFKSIKKEKPDLIVLDLMLPGEHGFEACKRLKKEEKFKDIPVIILSANSDEPDKVFGLEIGADDYIAKPFSLNELHARIKAVLRRRGVEAREKVIKLGSTVVIDLEKFEVKASGQKVALTLTEFKILEQLASRKGQVFSRERMLDNLWGTEKIVIARTIDVHIRHLREKLGKAGEFVKNVRGRGYKIEE